MSLDTLWERMKKRSRRFQLADAHPDQTHVSHALVTVLLFGSMGVGLTMMAGGVLGWMPPIVLGLRWGIYAGVVFYAGREIANRVSVSTWLCGEKRWLRWVRIPIGFRFHPVKIWDGICDVLVPLWVTAPILTGSLELLWVLSVLVAALYFLFRPLP